MVRKSIIIVSVLFFFTVFLSQPAFAVCRASLGQSCNKDEFPRVFKLQFQTGPTDKNFNSIDPQCTNPIAASGSDLRLCCDTQEEANAYDSVRAPLCGSSQELGANNSTCWSCDDGGLRCAGASFGIAQKPDGSPDTDPALLDVNNREAINGGDTAQVWRVKKEALAGKQTIRYNGIDYPIPSDLVMCTANNKACGASNTTCHGKNPETTAAQTSSAAPLEVKGETVFANVPLDKRESAIVAFLDRIPFIPNDIVLKIAGYIKPTEDILSNPALERFSKSTNNATKFALKPLSLQQITTDAKNCQPYQVTGRICAWDKNGKFINDAISETKYYSTECNPSGTNDMRQGLTQLSSYSTVHRQNDQNYERPELGIRIKEPLECEADDSADPQKISERNSKDQNSFGRILDFVVKLPWAVAIIFGQSQREDNKWNVEGGPKVIIKETLLSPWTAESLCYGPECQSNDISRVQYPLPEDIKTSNQKVASLRTFQPLAHDYPGKLHGGKSDQPFDLAFSNQSAKTQTAFSFANRLEKGFTYTYCILTPRSKQRDAEFFPNGECDQDWSRKKPPPDQQSPPISNFALGSNTSTNGVPPTLGQSGSGSDRRPDGTIRNAYMENIIKQAADDAQIPACVLEAVGMIEGAYNWGQADSTNNPAQCVPNRCGAAGPFQITIGHNGDNSDCAKSCPEATYCPNTWGNRLGTPCDITNAAKAAAEILIAKSTYTSKRCGLDKVPTLSNTNPSSQESSIRRAACGYYGSNSPQSSLVYNGKQISYADFVVEHCRLFPQGQTVTPSTRNE